MGCSCSKDSNFEKISFDKKNGVDSYFFNFKMTLPDKTLKATFEIDREKIILFELVNNICFNSKFGEILDANFINKYNENIDNFDYYIERIYGKKIENDKNPEQGKMWIPYINNHKEDWSDICRKNRVITSSDTVEFIYEADTDIQV